MNAVLSKHRELLERAAAVCVSREQWSGFVESPSTKIHGEEAPALGKAAFEARLNRPFELDQPGTSGRVGEEISPYTLEPLGIDYPCAEVGALCDAAVQAMRSWQQVEPDTRAMVCIELLKSLEQRLFENAHATMHTAGQSFMMGFVGSGANALDRGLEAIVYAHKAMTDLPLAAQWSRQLGARRVAFDKRYHFMPRGVALVMCCATFPSWNAYPAIMANLMTGNPVVVKPHPAGILPMAIAVGNMREVLAANGFDSNLVTMAADTREQPVARAFFDREDVAIVDFTGSQRFGSWLEHKLRDKLLYTETSGVNAIVIESAPDLDGMVDAIAHSLCLFSSQMCTSPQNIHLGGARIDTDQGPVDAADLAALIVERIERKVEEPGSAGGLCGALQSDETVQMLESLTVRARAIGSLLRPWKPYVHPEFPQARTATPLVIGTDNPDQAVLRTEHFGPACFVIGHETREQALDHAATDARKHGAIATHTYSMRDEFLDRAEGSFVAAGASVTFNMTGPIPLNYAAAYSDLHVTGLNPAGNACLTDLNFVCDRFRIVQCRWPEGSRQTSC
jgi:phenylacetic acid degradation protein paaN